MQSKLLITGQSGMELIRTVLGDALAFAGGYVVEHGCELYPAAHTGGVQGFDGLRFLELDSVPPTHDTEVFRGEGVRLLTEAEYYPFALLDTVGGFEILVPQFCAALVGVIRSQLPCVGTLISMDEAQRMKDALGLGTRYIRKLDALYELLNNDADVLIIDAASPDAESILRRWKAIYNS